MTQGSPAAPAPQSARIDRALLDGAIFPATMTMPVRFDDLDVQWHVNNAASVIMLQEARICFTRDMALPPFSDTLRMVVGAMMVEYAHEITYPGDVEIGSGILRVGNSAFTFGQLIRQNGKPCVYSQVTMVMTGPGGSQPIPDAFREIIAGKAMIVPSANA